MLILPLWVFYSLLITIMNDCIAAGLFLGIWNGGVGVVDKCLGCVNIHEAQIYIKKH